MVRKCAVLGCQTTKGPFFSFPNPYKDEERCQMWVSASGNPIIHQIGKEQLKHKVICKQHFAINCLYSKKLTASAVPTLKLPERKVLVEPNTSPDNMDLTATENTTDLRMQAPIDEYHLNFYDPLKENWDGSIVNVRPVNVVFEEKHKG